MLWKNFPRPVLLVQLTHAEKVCAWIDVSNSLRPESVAAAGVDLNYLLWVRCGVNSKVPVRSEETFTLPGKYMIAPPEKRGLYGRGLLHSHDSRRSEVRNRLESATRTDRPASIKIGTEWMGARNLRSDQIG